METLTVSCGSRWTTSRGPTPGRLLAERYPDGMPADKVVRIVTAVADALDYAHQRGLLHRDVKPANILMANPDTEDKRIMLADFGIARWVGEPSALTGTNMTVGTVAYAAPEQLKGEEIDGRADQYALAATAFQLLTGAPPFQHSNPAVVISKHLTADPPKIGTRRPELSSLGPIFDKALAKSPDDRYDRCIDFARALAHHIGTEEQDAAYAMQRCWPRPRRGPRHARQEAKPRRRIVLAGSHRAHRDRGRRSRFRAVRPHPRPLRRSQVTPVVRTVYASPGVTGRCHVAGGGRRRQLCDVGRGGHHRRRRAGVLRTPVDDECHDLVAVSG